jgi:hypothetical protein
MVSSSLSAAAPLQTRKKSGFASPVSSPFRISSPYSGKSSFSMSPTSVVHRRTMSNPAAVGNNALGMKANTYTMGNHESDLVIPNHVPRQSPLCLPPPPSLQNLRFVLNSRLHGTGDEEESESESLFSFDEHDENEIQLQTFSEPHQVEESGLKRSASEKIRAVSNGRLNEQKNIATSTSALTPSSKAMATSTSALAPSLKSMATSTSALNAVSKVASTSTSSFIPTKDDNSDGVNVAERLSATKKTTEAITKQNAKNTEDEDLKLLGTFVLSS